MYCTQDDDLIGSIPLEEDLQIRVVTDPKAPPVSLSGVCWYVQVNSMLCLFCIPYWYPILLYVCIRNNYPLTQNCFEIYKEDGVIKAWKKDSDGKPVPGQ